MPTPVVEMLVQPDGKEIVKSFMAYVLVEGFESVNVKVPAVEALIQELSTLTVPGLAFAAWVVVAKGTRKRSPDTRSSAAMVPEVSFE